MPKYGSGQYWYVCTLDGSNGKITLINQVVETEPGVILKAAMDKDKEQKKTVIRNRNILTWSWNFGDGGNSTNQNPVHNYSSNGTYTVSLTVSDYFTSNTKTRTAYIQVGPIGVNEIDRESEIEIYPNPVKDEFHISAGFKIKSVSLYDINGLLIFRREGIENGQMIETGDLPDGIYMVSIDGENGRVSKKIMVVK